MKPGLTVFIPVYNEADLLRPHLACLTACLESTGIPFEILVGSNGSTDATVGLLKSISGANPRIRWFHLPQKGVGKAFQTGVRLAEYERIITMDMDLSIRLDFIAEAYGLLDCHDMVIGSKIAGTQQRRWIRRVASNGFVKIADMLLGIDFKDYSIAAKAYHKSLISGHLDQLDDHTFYVLEIVYRLWIDGKRLIQIPVECVDTRASRFNLLHEGVYKFGHLFWLWLRALKQCPRPPR